MKIRPRRLHLRHRDDKNPIFTRESLIIRTIAVDNHPCDGFIFREGRGMGKMHKSIVALIVGVASAALLALPAAATVVAVPDVPLSFQAEQIENFNVGTEYEFTFTTTDPNAQLDISPFGTPGPGNTTALQIFWGNPPGPPNNLTFDSGFSERSILVGAGSWAFFVTLVASANDPPIGFELDDGGVTLSNPLAAPLPAALPLFAGGLGIIGLVSRRRRRKTSAALAAC
jgi:hypothetical protein